MEKSKEDIFSRFRLMLSKKSVFFLYRQFVAPRSEHEDERRREYILNVLLLGSLALAGPLTVAVIYDAITMGRNYQGVATSPFLLFFITFSLLLALSRSGYHKTASYILVLLYLAGTTYSMIRWGPDLPVVLISYSLLVVISSILIGTEFGFFTAGFIIIAIYVVGYLQARHSIPLTYEWRLRPFRVFRDGFAYTLLIFLIGVVSWLANRETSASLNRARASEAALKQERDLLEVKVEQRTRELQKIQLQEISRLDRFVEFGRQASGIFHDLMTPLTAIALHIENMSLVKSEDVALAKSAMNKAIVDTRRMEQFIQALRRHMSQEQTYVRFDVVEEIKYIIQLFHHKAQLLNITIDFDGPDSTYIEGDPLKFQQMVANLLSNGIDAYQEVPITHSLPQKICARLTTNQDALILTVQDWGKGIPENLLPKIFEPFFTTKDINQGTGIGLSTTKYLVEEELRGTISVQSTPHAGAIFTITIPHPSHNAR